MHAGLQDIEDVLVAISTEQLNDTAVDRRSGIRGGQDVVNAVARDTAMGGGVDIRKPVAVGSGQRLLGHVVVTHGAVHGRQRRIVLELGVDQIFMAFDALEVTVDGLVEGGRIDVEIVHVLVVVAVVAHIAVLRGRRVDHPDGDDRHDRDEKPLRRQPAHEPTISLPCPSCASNRVPVYDPDHPQDFAHSAWRCQKRATHR